MFHFHDRGRKGKRHLLDALLETFQRVCKSAQKTLVEKTDLDGLYFLDLYIYIYIVCKGLPVHRVFLLWKFQGVERFNGAQILLRFLKNIEKLKIPNRSLPKKLFCWVLGKSMIDIFQIWYDIVFLIMYIFLFHSLYIYIYIKYVLRMVYECWFQSLFQAASKMSWIFRRKDPQVTSSLDALGDGGPPARWKNGFPRSPLKEPNK